MSIFEFELGVNVDIVELAIVVFVVGVITVVIVVVLVVIDGVIAGIYTIVGVEEDD